MIVRSLFDRRWPNPRTDRLYSRHSALRCTTDIRMTQHLARGRQAVAGIDLASVFFAERVERSLRRTPFERSHAISSWMSLWQR